MAAGRLPLLRHLLHLAGGGVDLRHLVERQVDTSAAGLRFDPDYCTVFVSSLIALV